MSFAYDDYVFDLPKELIAQHPSATRDASRLMVCQAEGEPQHHQFREIGRYFRSGDALVLNQTRVMKARCFAQKETGTRIEVFILNIQVAPQKTPVLLRPAKRVKQGMELHFPNADVRVTVTEKGDMGKGVLAFPDFETLQKRGWTVDDLAYALRTGVMPDGDVFGGAMGEVVNYGTSFLTDEDRKAMATYLLDVHDGG